MKEWTYLISIPFAATLVSVFWYYLATEYVDAIPAWIVAGLVVHGALAGIIYHCYRTLTGTWVRPKKKKKNKV